MQLFLTGYMGSGKSTLGKRLAHMLGVAFLDLDDYFEQKYKTSISLFFERFGEESFRQLEHETLREVIAAHDKTVISTGGGTPCYFDNMELMNRHGFTIYLRLAPGVLASRLSNSPFRYKRPMLKGLNRQDLLQTVSEHLAERETFYNRSKLIVDVFEMKTESIVNKIVEAMAGIDGELPANK